MGWYYAGGCVGLQWVSGVVLVGVGGDGTGYETCLEVVFGVVAECVGVVTSFGFWL